MATEDAWPTLSTLHEKKKLASLLHFYAIKVTNFCFQTKRSYILNEGKHFKKKTCLIRNASFCQRKCGVENSQPAHFCFLYILMGLNFLFQIEERDLKSPNHIFQHPIICQSIFPSVFFHCKQLVCFYLGYQD